MKRTLRNIGLTLALIGSTLGAGCSGARNYRISNEIDRAAAQYNDPYAFYNSIDPSRVTPAEAAFIDRFYKMDQEKREQMMNDGFLKEFNFLSRKNPSIRDLIFLHEADQELSGKSALLKVPRSH
jgi:hypothetical protein